MPPGSECSFVQNVLRKTNLLAIKLCFKCMDKSGCNSFSTQWTWLNCSYFNYWVSLGSLYPYHPYLSCLIYHYELAPIVTKTEVHNLHLASWRPETDFGIVLGQDRDLGPRRANDVSTSLRAGED